jgi:hypothetical protein
MTCSTRSCPTSSTCGPEPVRLAGLRYPKHLYAPSDEEVIERWLENPRHLVHSEEELGANADSPKNRTRCTEAFGTSTSAMTEGSVAWRRRADRPAACAGSGGRSCGAGVRPSSRL